MDQSGSLKTGENPPDTLTTETVSMVHSGPLQVKDVSSSTVRVWVQGELPRKTASQRSAKSL